jgi:hypothetical protein
VTVWIGFYGVIKRSGFHQVLGALFNRELWL